MLNLVLDSKGINNELYLATTYKDRLHYGKTVVDANVWISKDLGLDRVIAIVSRIGEESEKKVFDNFDDAKKWAETKVKN